MAHKHAGPVRRSVEPERITSPLREFPHSPLHLVEKLNRCFELERHMRTLLATQHLPASDAFLTEDHPSKEAVTEEVHPSLSEGPMGFSHDEVVGTPVENGRRVGLTTHLGKLIVPQELVNVPHNLSDTGIEVPLRKSLWKEPSNEPEELHHLGINMGHAHGSSTMHQVCRSHELQRVRANSKSRVLVKSYRDKSVDVSDRLAGKLLWHRPTMNEILEEARERPRICPTKVLPMVLVEPQLWIGRLFPTTSCLKGDGVRNYSREVSVDLDGLLHGGAVHRVQKPEGSGFASRAFGEGVFVCWGPKPD